LDDCKHGNKFNGVVTTEDEMGGTCGTRGGKQNAIGNLMGKPEGKRPHGGSTHIVEYVIKMYLKEMGRF
jgi:hypothetical protein